jgi:hypothetical protein
MKERRVLPRGGTPERGRKKSILTRAIVGTTKTCWQLVIQEMHYGRTKQHDNRTITFVLLRASSVHKVRCGKNLQNASIRIATHRAKYPPTFVKVDENLIFPKTEITQNMTSGKRELFNDRTVLQLSQCPFSTASPRSIVRTRRWSQGFMIG